MFGVKWEGRGRRERDDKEDVGAGWEGRGEWEREEKVGGGG